MDHFLAMDLFLAINNYICKELVILWENTYLL